MTWQLIPETDKRDISVWNPYKPRSIVVEFDFKAIKAGPLLTHCATITTQALVNKQAKRGGLNSNRQHTKYILFIYQAHSMAPFWKQVRQALDSYRFAETERALSQRFKPFYKHLQRKIRRVYVGLTITHCTLRCSEKMNSLGFIGIAVTLLVDSSSHLQLALHEPT